VDLSRKFGVAKVYDSQLMNYLTILHDKAVDVLEIGFAEKMPELPSELVKSAKGLGISLTCHLPFTINLAEERDRDRCVRYLAQGIRYAKLMDGLAVFHPGFYGGHPFEEVKSNLLGAIKQALVEEPLGRGKLGIETTGKKAEIGSLEEVLLLVKEIDSDGVVPVIDWAHMYARTQGTFPRSLDDFAEILGKIQDEFDLEMLHCHASGIEFGTSGERKHVSAKTCSPPIPYLMHVLKQNQVSFQMVIESPDPLEDLAWLKLVLEDPERWFPLVEQRHERLQKGLMDAYF
jgi:deoxyribonuclease-4